MAGLRGMQSAHGRCLSYPLRPAQLTFALLLPTTLLLALKRRRGSGASREAEPPAAEAGALPPAPPPVVALGPDEPLGAACFVASQLLWLALRVLLDGAEAE